MVIPLIMISGKFSGDTAWEVEQCVRLAEDASLKLYKLGAAVICLHTMGRHFANTMPYENWIEISKEYVRRSDALLFLPNYLNSVGAKIEYEYATELGKTKFFEVNQSLRDWIYLC